MINAADEGNAKSLCDVRAFRSRCLCVCEREEVGFVDKSGKEILRAKFDYFSESDNTVSGYDCLGIIDGDGKVLTGDKNAVLDATSSLDRNFSELNCVFTTDSPTAAECPNWENRVVYEMWIAASAFGNAGFEKPVMNEVHASPSKLDVASVPSFEGPCPLGPF